MVIPRCFIHKKQVPIRYNEQQTRLPIFITELSKHCIYIKEEIKSESKSNKVKKNHNHKRKDKFNLSRKRPEKPLISLSSLYSTKFQLYSQFST